MKPYLLSLLLAACGTSEPAVDCASETPALPGTETFIAFNQSFECFRDWTEFDSPGPPPDSPPPEVPGPRTEYINVIPPSGSTEFPIGTIIVEVVEDGLGTDGSQILATVKRGGGFNGGLDWEWFEIKENPTAIVWRGFGPPAGESYGGDPNGCNTCHQGCGASNDLRCSPLLQLSDF